jgi:predicted tellurium resistance membrane protein TerC
MIVLTTQLYTVLQHRRKLVEEISGCKFTEIKFKKKVLCFGLFGCLYTRCVMLFLDIPLMFLWPYIWKSIFCKVKVIHDLRSALLWDITQSRVVKEFLTLADRTDCPEMAVQNYHSMLHTVPEDQGSHVHHSESLNSRMIHYMFWEKCCFLLLVS